MSRSSFMQFSTYVLGIAPPGTPPAYWASAARLRVALRAIVLLNTLIALVIIGALLLWLGTRRCPLVFQLAESYSGYLLLGLWIIFSVTMLYWLPRAHKARQRRFIQRHSYEVCTQCGYVLSGLPSVHECPECGTSYDVQDVRHRWIAWFDDSDGA